MSGPTLRARTRRLDEDPDLLGVGATLFVHPERGLAGAGAAAVVAVDVTDPAGAAQGVAAVLGAMAVEDEVGVPGTGPVALGALPFTPPGSSPGSGGALVVPAVVVGRAAGGARWITTVGPPDDPAHDAPPEALLAGAVDPTGARIEARPARFTVEAERAAADWCRSVADATAALRAGTADKVVLARAVRVSADQPFDRVAVLDRLRRAYPSCYLYAHDGFVGASPELLVSRLGDVVRCLPMAGTAPRSADPSTDARLAASLLASAKDREEHQITIDMVHDTLLPWCSYLDWEPEPHIAAMANVQHLATHMEGRLSDPPASSVELMAALHPTPAVGGSPRAAALAMIDRLEGLDRRCFGGPVGWVDASGDGEWAVAIRSAHLDGSVARCYAGVGVVADSDPASELAETNAKLQPMLTALIQP